MRPRIVALVPAAGTGTRLGESLPKQYIELNGKPLIFHALDVLGRVSRIAGIAVVISPEDAHWGRLMANSSPVLPFLGKVTSLAAGGPTRGETVLNGLKAMSGSMAKDDWVMVHDAARPCLRPEWVERLIDELQDDQVGGLLALPLADTIKREDGNQRVESTLDRRGIWRAQTPQMFRYGMLTEALKRMPDATDEAQAIEALGQRPRLVMGDSANLKVTFAADLRLARMLLSGED